MQGNNNRFKKLKIEIIKKRKKEKRQKEKKKKKKPPLNCKMPTQRFITTIKIVTEYIQNICTRKENQNSPTKVKYNRLTCQTKETKNYFYQLRTKLIKAQTGKQNKSKMPIGE